MGEPNLYPIPLNCAPPAAAKFRAPPRKPNEVLPKSPLMYHYTIKEHKVDIDHDSWIKTVRQKVNEACPKFQPSGPCTIFKVPEKIRQRGDDGKVYNPLVASIGPYHYFPDQRGTARAMQDHKWRCVRHLLSRHRSRDRASQLLDRCLAALKALDGEVRSCYSENLYYLDPPKLASIMLMDGCFIIHLLLKQVENKTVEEEEEEEEIVVVVEEDSKEEEKGKGKVEGEEEEKVELEMGKGEEEIEGPLLGMLWIWNSVVFDLLKLENQIPFFIIQTIFDILKTPGDKGVDIVSLALRLFRDIHPNKSEAIALMPVSQIHHLLHLFHSSLVPLKPRSPASTPPEWMLSATELKRAAVKFTKKEAAESFLDVTFNDGTMEIPPLRVYDYSDSLFRNLIVFEQCFPDAGKYVTNYASFMERIIGSAEDARLLDTKGIVVNRLGTDQAVVDLFNRRNNHIHYASDGNYLADVFVKAKKYHESKWHRWRAGLIRDYFSNPWAGVAVVAAVLLLFLIIEQSFFAAFSYFRPS